MIHIRLLDEISFNFPVMVFCYHLLVSIILFILFELPRLVDPKKIYFDNLMNCFDNFSKVGSRFLNVRIFLFVLTVDEDSLCFGL